MTAPSKPPTLSSPTNGGMATIHLAKDVEQIVVLFTIALATLGCNGKEPTGPLGNGEDTAPGPEPSVSEAKFTASDGATGDLFGSSVSTDRDYGVVGAYWDDDNGTNSGSVYVFHNDGNGWRQETKLTAGEGADNFGVSVSLSGDYLIVGAHQDDDGGNNSGSAYVLHRNGSSWTQQTKLTAGDGAAGDFFGYSVSIDGDYAIVGAYQDDDHGTNSGAAYIFHRSGSSWTQQTKLTPGDGAAGDFFGYSVSIDGDYAIVGAHKDDDNGINSGSSYVFHRNGGSWTQEAKLTASDGAKVDNFGYSVSVSGARAIVGAHLDDDNGRESGSAYVFHRSGSSWSEEDKLTTSSSVPFARFGASVSISGDRVIVGAHRDDHNGADSGAAYVFRRNGTSWTIETRLTANDGSAGDLFGFSVSLGGNYSLVGATGVKSYTGSAYVYSQT